MSKHKKILFEDLVTFQDKWATGMSGRSVGPSQITLIDLLKRGDSGKQHPNNVQAPGTVPHGAQMLIELIGDLLHQIVLVRQAINTAKTNPILHRRPKAKAQINKILRKVSMIRKIVRLMAKDIDNFSIDKSSE